MRFGNDNSSPSNRRSSSCTAYSNSSYSSDWLLHAQGVYEAWSALKEWRELPEDQQPPCFGVSLQWSWPSREAGDLRFMAHFEQLFSNERRMQVLELKDATFRPDSPNEPFYRRLMTSMLPRHPHLHTIVFEDCRISAPFIEMLFSALSHVESNEGGNTSSSPSASSRIKCVEFRQTKLDAEAIAAIARHLDSSEGSASRLQQLRFHSCGVSTESCNLLLRSLRTNTSLRSLVLERNYVFDIDQEAAQALGTNDALTALVLEEPMLGLEQGDASTGDASTSSSAGPESAAHPNVPATSAFRSMEPVRRLAKALRRNKRLQVLHVPVSEGRDLREPHPIEELLEHHNFTLLSVKAGYEYSNTDAVQCRVQALLERNQLYRQLEAVQYVVEPLEAWSVLLPRISSQPSVLFKFLRDQGNVSLLSNHIFISASQTSTRKERANDGAQQECGWHGACDTHKRNSPPALSGERTQKRVFADECNVLESVPFFFHNIPLEGPTM